MDDLKHLELLKGYKEDLYNIYKVNFSKKELEIWLIQVVTFFERSVFDSEVGNTEIIAEMNKFVIKFKQSESDNELSETFEDLIINAEDIIDKAIAVQASKASIN